MKTKTILLFLLTILIVTPLTAQQTVQETDYFDPIQKISISKNVSSGTYSTTAGEPFQIGRGIFDQNQLIYRTYYSFDLSEIAAKHNVSIDEVKLDYDTGNDSGTFKVTGPSSISRTNIETHWNAIGNASSKESGISYGDNEIISTGLKSYVEAQLFEDYLIIGALSEDEGEDDTLSISTLDIDLEITYTYEAYPIIVRNDFNGLSGGNIGVGKNTTAVSRSSPDTVTAINGDQINLEAYDNQNINGYTWVFNDTEAPVNKSSWRIFDGNNTQDLNIDPASQSTYHNTNNDQGAVIFNEQKRVFSITRNDYSPELGSNFNSANISVVEGNTLSAPATQTDNGKSYAFYEWSDGVTENPRTIDSPTSSLTARYKAVHRSDDSEAFTNNSQRRLIQTEVDGNVWLHQVYTSMGHVWIEHSDDGGSTWTIGNDGKPLDGGAGGKNPSIAYTQNSVYTNGSWLYLNYIGVVWQQPHSSTYKIMGKMFTQSSTGSQLPGDGSLTSTLHTEPSDSYSVDANPGLALSEFVYHPYLVTFERKSTSGSWSAGINWVVGKLLYDDTYETIPFGDVEGEGVISGTNASSLHAQSSLVSSQQYEMGVNVIRQQGTGNSGKIYAHFILLTDIGSLNNTGSINWDVYQYDHNNGNPISSTGYSWSPSLVTLGNDNSNFSACWIEYTDMVYYYLGNPTSRYYYGYYDAESCSINRGSGSNVNDGYAVWSQTLSGSSWDNISILFDEGIPQSGHTRTLSTSGKYMQLGNSVTGSTANMYVSAFKPTGSSPYSFQTSSSMGPAPKQVKQEIVEHRGFILNVGETAFRYRFGGLEVDGQYIRFAEAPDTADYGNLETLNNALLTEPFQVTANAEIVFTERPGFADSAAAAKALGKGDYIRYKLELIDEATGQKVGTLREENITASQVRNERSRAFAVNPAGLAGKTVRAKVTLETNLVKQTEPASIREEIPEGIPKERLNRRHSNLVLTKHYRKAGEGEAMDKSALEELSTIEESPESFQLGQNYPNPFNPSTVISYQLPENTMVRLEVFDLLGRSVATLVNERQSTGKYSVRFDAGHLASGVYLYRLNAGEFTASKKLFLIK